MTPEQVVRGFISLGSNQQNPRQQVQNALAEINNIPDTKLLNVSSWYRSTPLGPGDQPDYINGVAVIETILEPHRLLEELQKIEQLHHRRRTVRWGPRTLDLDILLLGDLQLTTPDLVIPHSELHRRNFVLYPLAELDPDLILPDKKSLADLLANVSSQGIVRLAEN